MELLYFFDKNWYVVIIKDLEYFIYRVCVCFVILDIISVWMVILQNLELLLRVVFILVENFNIKVVVFFVLENRWYKFGYNMILLIMYCFLLKKYIMMWWIFDIFFKLLKKSFYWQYNMII